VLRICHCDLLAGGGLAEGNIEVQQGKWGKWAVKGVGGGSMRWAGSLKPYVRLHMGESSSVPQS